VFSAFSVVSAQLIAKKGTEYTMHLGGAMAFLGAACFFATGYLLPHSVPMIIASVSLMLAGGAMMPGTFGFKALTIFPELSGTALALSTALRQLLAGGLVVLTQLFFNGTIFPIAAVILVYACVAAAAYAMFCYGRDATVG
jgi:hypothetical protein